MTGHILPALIVFGALFAICVFGLTAASAASERLLGSRQRNETRDRGSAAPTAPRS